MINFIARISELRKQLLDLGYHEFQLDSIIRDTVGKANIENLTDEECLELIKILEQYVSFARKCRNKH